MFFRIDDFKLAIVTFAAICAAAGAALFAAIYFIAPWVWSLIKPWLHTITM